MQTCWDAAPAGAAASAAAAVDAELARTRCAPCEAGLPSLRHISSLLGAQATETGQQLEGESAADRLSQRLLNGC